MLRNHLKALVRRSARRLDLEIVSRRGLPDRLFDVTLARIFEELAIDFVLDIGANKGQFRDRIRHEIGFRGPIVSVEPLADNIKTLRHRAERDPHWSIEGLALGRAAGVRTINVMKQDVFSSFLKPNEESASEFSGQNEILRTEPVQVDTLDALFGRLQARFQFKRPYLKLDTQGFDLEILQGGPRALTQFSALQTESSIVPIYEGMPSYTESLQFLHARGFDLSWIAPVTLDSQMRLIEVDCVLIRRAGSQFDHRL